MMRTSTIKTRINGSVAFAFLMCIGVFLHFLFIINPHLLSGAFSHQLFFNESFYGYESLYSDFFYVLSAIDSGNPYTGELPNAMYPPLANLVFVPFSFTGDYAGMSLEEAQSYLPGLFACSFYLLLIVIIFFYSLTLLGRKYSFRGWHLFLLFFSPVFLFAFERANVVILAGACINFFLYYYDSADYNNRRKGLFFICLAVALKLWPLLFGLLLLSNPNNKETRWKEIMACIIITSLLLTIPFLFFNGGFGNFPIMVDALAYFNKYNEFSISKTGWIIEFGLHNLFLTICSFLGSSSHTISQVYVVSQIISYLLIGTSVFLIAIDKTFWRKWMLMTIVVIMMCKTYYYGLYFFSAIILYFESKDKSIMGILYAFLFFLFLSPFQCRYSIMSIEFVINASLILIWILTIIHSCKVLLGSVNLNKK